MYVYIYIHISLSLSLSLAIALREFSHRLQASQREPTAPQKQCASELCGKLLHVMSQHQAAGKLQTSATTHC